MTGTSGEASEGSEERVAGNQGRSGPAQLDCVPQVHGEEPVPVADDRKVRGLPVRKVCSGEKARVCVWIWKGTKATIVITRRALGRD